MKNISFILPETGFGGAFKRAFLCELVGVSSYLFHFRCQKPPFRIVQLMQNANEKKEENSIKNLVRYNLPGNVHGLTFTCYGNHRFLNYDRTRNYFAEALENAKMKHNFDLWAYVIMLEHVHLIIFPRDEIYSISEILKSIKQPVARKSISYLQERKSDILRFMETGCKHHPFRFWQAHGGFDRNIRDSVELIKLMNYIHENPVRRGLVARIEDWIWSSARDWMYGTDSGPILIDRECYPVR